MADDRARSAAPTGPPTGTAASRMRGGGVLATTTLHSSLFSRSSVLTRSSLHGRTSSASAIAGNEDAQYRSALSPSGRAREVADAVVAAVPWDVTDRAEAAARQVVRDAGERAPVRAVTQGRLTREVEPAVDAAVDPYRSRLEEEYDQPFDGGTAQRARQAARDLRGVARQQARQAREELRQLPQALRDAARDGARGSSDSATGTGQALGNTGAGGFGPPASTPRGISGRAMSGLPPVDEARQRALQASYRAGRRGRQGLSAFAWAIPVGIFVVLTILSRL